MKIAKKTLSVFLSILMVFSACSVGVFGVVAMAAEASLLDSDGYTVDEVKALISAAASETSSSTSSSDNWTYSGSYAVLTAVDAIFYYATTTYTSDYTYSSHKGPENATGVVLYNNMISDLGYSSSSNEAKLIKNVLVPDGTDVYSYTSDLSLTKTGSFSKLFAGYSKGADVTEKSIAEDSYASISENFSKTVSVEVSTSGLNDYLLTFESVADIPSKIPTKITLTYNYDGIGKYAVITSKNWAGTNEGKSYIWNYMTSAPKSRVAAKNTKAKKNIKSFVEYFDDDVLSLTFADMLEMSAADLNNYYLVATAKVDAMTSAGYSTAVLDHFMKSDTDYTYSDITTYIDNLQKAYQIVLLKGSIDTLFSDIGTDYTDWSYSQMSALYASLSSAYEVVASIDSDALTFILENYDGYSDKYTAVSTALTDAKAYIDQLYLDMRVQHLKELNATMNDMYDSYYEMACDTNNLDDITTTQLAAIVDKADGINSALGNYTAAEINAIISAEDQENWSNLVLELKSKLEVRDDEAIYDSYLDYFTPLLYKDFAGMTTEELIDLYNNAQTEYDELVDVYNTFVDEYGQEWTDELFTYEVNGEKGLLQDLLVANYTDSNAALVEYIKALNASQLATIEAYAGLTTVDFTNYADLKSTLSHFDEDLYNFCLDNGWCSDEDKAVYASIADLLAAWKAFTSTDGYSAFTTNTYADENGVYTIRYAGDQTETDDEDNEVQIGYPNDIARDNEDNDNDGAADDNYVVDAETIEETIVKIDNFVTSADFGALIGLKDENGNRANLETYINELFDTLFTDELMNTLVAAVFPMLTDLIDTELKNVIADLGDPEYDGTGGYDLEIGSKAAGVYGTLDIYIDDDIFNHDGDLLHMQNYFADVFADVGLHVYPRTLGAFLADTEPGLFGPTTDIYKALMAADRDWNYFADENGDIKLDFEWGVYDLDSFMDVLGIVLDSMLPLLQAALGDTTFEEVAPDAAFVYGKPKIYLVYIGANHSLAAQGELTLTIDALNLYNKLLVPLFEVFRLDDYGYTLPTLTGEFDGSDIVNAIFGPVLELLNQLLDQPLTKLLDILPNLIYFLSMNSIQEIIDSVNINLNLNISDVDIKTAYSGAVGDIASLFESSFAGLIEFDLGISLAELVDLDDLLDFNITDLNDILQTLLADKMELPDLDQTTIMMSSTWNYQTSANGSTRVNLKANQADILYALLSYVVSALGQEGFLDSLLGSKLDDNVKALINKIAENVYYNQNGALAAIMEILAPQEYELNDFEWAESTWAYGTTFDDASDVVVPEESTGIPEDETGVAEDETGVAEEETGVAEEETGVADDNDDEVIKGADMMSIVYLNYGNDWTKEDAQYIIENSDELVAAILEMTGSDLGSLNDWLAETVDDLFTNSIITKLVKVLGGFGDSPSEVLKDILVNQIGVDICVWFDAFGYLYADGTWKDDAVVLSPSNKNYSSTFENVTGVANEDGSITWYFGDTALVDGDKEVFINIFCELAQQLEIVIGFLFGGWDIKAFNDLLELKGYETYATTFGILFETLGVENLPSQATVSADPMEGLRQVLQAVAAWFDMLVNSDNMIETVLEIVPDLFYWIESNGLGTFIHNLIMPVLVLVDDVRPLLDVNINDTLSLLVSELLNNNFSLDFNVILSYLAGEYVVPDGDDYKWYSVDINDLRLSSLIGLVDTYVGTDLANSGLVQIGLKGFCSGLEEYESVSGTGYKTTVDAADALTIIITAVIDCLSYPANDEQTNGDVILAFVEELTGKDLGITYEQIANILNGIELKYDNINWGYMFTADDVFSTTLPTHTIVYLGYNTDWTEEAAEGVYDSLDAILELVLDSVLDEGETLKTLVDGLLSDNLYTDDILNTIIESLVNLLADFDETLRDVVDCVVSTDISTWFEFCEYNEEKDKWVCTYDWGVDDAIDKQGAFVAGIKQVLDPANDLLAWLFFGDSYTFFTSSEVDEEGNYTYADLITLNGGEGYAYGLVPIFEALGCDMEPASTFYDEETGKYNVGDAVESILHSILELADNATSDPIGTVLDLLPNLIYFINADGIKASVNNLLAPVDGILEQLAPLVGDTSLGGLLEESIGLNISDISMDTLLEFAESYDVVINDDIKLIIKNFYIGCLEKFTSANGRTAYRMGYTEDEDEADMITIILSLALDLFNDNETLFSDLLGAENYTAVKTLMANASETFVYETPDWGYMYEGESINDRIFALKDANGVLPERDSAVYATYTKYTNNWNKNTVDYLDEILEDLADDIATSIAKEDSTIGDLVKGLLEDNVYSDDVLNSLIEMAVGALVDYEEIIVNAGALLGAEGLKDWFDYCEITEDENGKTVVTCTKNWGVDDADDKQTAFIDAFEEALQPANRLLAWLLLGEDYEFFEGTTDDVLITIKGGDGYANAIAPLFEALGVDMPDASAFEDTGDAVAVIAYAATELLNLYCESPVDAILNLVPNLIYFLNADGVKAVVNNLLVPVNNILDALGAFGVDLDLSELVDGLDITNITTEALLKMLKDELGISLSDELSAFIETFYIGKLVPTTFGYRLAFTDEETRGDMITILLSVALEIFADENNAEVFGDLLKDYYEPIMKLLSLAEEKAMQDYGWIYTQYADTDTVFNATETSVKYEAAYNNIWTRDMAEYIANNLPDFVSNILGLIGLEINGVAIKDLDDLLDSLLDGYLYTADMANTILDALKSLTETISGLEPYGEYIVGILDNSLDVDLAAWDSMEAYTDDDVYDRDSFVAALEEMVAPVVPLLSVLLCEEDISFFYNIEGEDVITIYGSAGYAYGIVPLFEALGCEMMAPDEFCELSDEAKVGAILNSLLDRVDVILEDPVNEIFAMLPEIIYFINSNGLGTAVNNILNSVDTVLECLYPIIGATSLMELLGVELDSIIDFESLITMACEAIEDSTGLDVTPVIVDFVAELTMGKVVSYESANGETYYKMIYAGENQFADMITILLRLVIDFLATDGNADAIIALIADNSESDEAASSAAALITLVLKGLNVEPMTSGAMATIYWIYYGLDHGVDGLDYLYGNYGDSWDSLVDIFEESDDPTADKLVTLIKNILSEIGGIDTDSSRDDCDCNCHSNSSFVRFFFKLINFLRRIFGMTQYRYCDCGEAHW